jgi:hypothetical protein
VTLSGVSKKDEVKEREKVLKSMFLIRIGKQEKQNFNDYFLKANWEKHHKLIMKIPKILSQKGLN